jgi:hypothetical protein
MEDLSAKAAGSPWVTSQAAGRVSDPEHAMTAHGSPPAVEPAIGWDDPPAPEVVPEHYAAGNRADGGEPEDGARWETVAERPWRP